MAFLGAEGREYPGAYKPGTGTITYVNEQTAYAKPDQPNYGDYIYINRKLADKNCPNLNFKYEVGDRVSFIYVKAKKPGGYDWAAINLAKIEDNTRNSSDEMDDGNLVASGISNITTKSTVATESASADCRTRTLGTSQTQVVEHVGKKEIIPDAKGYIDTNGVSFATIRLYAPYEGRALVNDNSVNASFKDQTGVFWLAEAFPKNTRVVCDLQPLPYDGWYLALNVVIDKSSNEQRKENSADTVSAEGQRTSDAETAHPPGFHPSRSSTKPTQECVDSKNPGNAETFALSVIDASVQTDVPIEQTLLERLFDDQDMFRQLCIRLPDIMFRYLSRHAE